MGRSALAAASGTRPYTLRVALSDVFLLIGWLLTLLTLVILIRVIISWVPHINAGSPFIRVVKAIADPVLTPFRGVLPTLGGMLDLSPVLAIVVLEVLSQIFFNLSNDASVGASSVVYYLLSAIEQIVLTLVVIVIVLTLLRFIVTLFHADPRHPLTRAVRAMAAPFCRPFEGITISGRSSSVDVGALVATGVYIVTFVVLQVIFTRIILPAVA